MRVQATRQTPESLSTAELAERKPGAKPMRRHSSVSKRAPKREFPTMESELTAMLSRELECGDESDKTLAPSVWRQLEKHGLEWGSKPEWMPNTRTVESNLTME